MMDFECVTQRYLNNLQVNHYSPQSLAAHQYRLCFFFRFIQAQNKQRLDEIEHLDVINFLVYLRNYKSKTTGKPLRGASINAIAGALRTFFEYLFAHDLLLKDLTAAIPAQTRAHELPKHILSHEEIKSICAVIAADRFIGYRDRLIMEILYNSGMRIHEALGLKTGDIDFPARSIRVKGKGRRERVVPITEALYSFLINYLHRVRPYFIKEFNADYLILTIAGKQMSVQNMIKRFRSYGREAGLSCHLTTHMFRHAFSVHLLKEGCDIVFISRLLGHQQLQTTEIYTQIENRELRSKLKRYHFFSNDTGNFIKKLL